MKRLSTKNITALIVAALEELKAGNILVLDVTDLTTITDAMIIATGRTHRQVKALSDKVLEKLGAARVPVLGVEGEREAEWILVDAGDVVAHIMQPATRAYYQLEKLWKADAVASTSTSP